MNNYYINWEVGILQALEEVESAIALFSSSTQTEFYNSIQQAI